MVLKKFFDENLAKGSVRPSNSPAASPVSSTQCYHCQESLLIAKRLPAFGFEHLKVRTTAQPTTNIYTHHQISSAHYPPPYTLTHTAPILILVVINFTSEESSNTPPGVYQNPRAVARVLWKALASERQQILLASEESSNIPHGVHQNPRAVARVSWKALASERQQILLEVSTLSGRYVQQHNQQQIYIPIWKATTPWIHRSLYTYNEFGGGIIRFSADRPSVEVL